MLIVIILVVFMVIYFYPSPKPIYMNVNIKDACCKADEEIKTEKKPMVEHPDALKEYKELLDNMYLSNRPVPKYQKPDGDELLAYASINSGKKVLQSQINRMVWNKYDAIPYLKEELDTHANSVWYDNEELEQLMYAG
jgi:hypothetical protein